MDASPLLIDVFEPKELVIGIRQSIPCEVVSLNSRGLLDVMWFTDHSITIERKTSFDLVGSMIDGSLEERLKLGIQNADECGLLIEGLITPHPRGVSCWTMAKNGKTMFPRRTYKTSYAELQSYLYRLDKLGITVYNTSTLSATTIALVSFYNNSKKDEHTTFTRYIKKQPHIEEKDPHVLTLMGLGGVKIGEVRAKALLKRFDTPFGLFTAHGVEMMEVEGVGSKLAEDILKSIGRL